ncbi:hypothetical protein [Granulicatella sp. 19428wC4_WM01]|nr:hypothetical protein [Granulicatella sp. 19428wC4_WM01]
MVEILEILQKVDDGDSQTQVRIDYLMTLLDVHLFANFNKFG